MKKNKEYLLPGQNEDDELFFNNIYYQENKERFSEEILKTVEKLFQKNNSLYSTINFDILFNTEIMNICNEEQLLRITHYPKVQEYILRNNSILMTRSLEYLMNKDENWIISLDRIIKKEDNYKDLMANLQTIDSKEITEEFIQNYLSIISDSENYFDIKNYNDIINYSEKKENICLAIFDGNFENVPENLKEFSENDLYKFALLEYKFGIDLEEAKRLINRYGTDSDKLPNNTIADYIRLLKSILQDKNIKNVINYAKDNNLLKKPWLGFPNARNAEGKILNMFADLYNETLYMAKPKDKLNMQETYIDTDGTEYSIDVYEIKNDFNLNVRVEGAFRNFKEPDDFNQYYENTNIDNHGNCESYIGNDSICIACFEKNDFIVGYNYIYRNSLTSCGSSDLGSENTDFSIYNEKSNFRIPEEMKNNTRCSYNEMIKERLIVNENGDVVKSKPNYIIWIEEDPKSEREMPSWKEKRENKKKWIFTKKAAAQLGVPIVVIDREYFAERETQKIDLMRTLIKGEDIDKEKYKEYLDQYGSLSKAELIEQLILKFENNRTGLQFNEKLNQTYFTQNQLERIINEVCEAIENMPSNEKKECYDSLRNISYKESCQAMSELSVLLELEILSPEHESYKKKRTIVSYYQRLIKKIYTKQASETGYLPKKDFNANDNLLKLYFGNQITYTDTDEAKLMIVNEQRENSKKEERNKNI